MTPTLPKWAMYIASGRDLAWVLTQHARDALQIEWPDSGALRRWMSAQRWPTPWFGLKRAALRQLLGSQANFERAVGTGGIRITLPRQDARLSGNDLRELDQLYEKRSPEGSPTDWNALVEGLRDIRRAVMAGVEISIDDGPTLRSWQQFYGWAHQRYPMLEDGCDHWIGDDRS